MVATEQLYLAKASPLFKPWLPQTPGKEFCQAYTQAAFLGHKPQASSFAPRGGGGEGKYPAIAVSKGMKQAILATIFFQVSNVCITVYVHWKTKWVLFSGAPDKSLMGMGGSQGRWLDREKMSEQHLSSPFCQKKSPV